MVGKIVVIAVVTIFAIRDGGGGNGDSMTTIHSTLRRTIQN